MAHSIGKCFPEWLPSESSLSMPPQLSCQTADFFVLRSPSLPLDALISEHPSDPEALRQTLRELVRRDAVREALALASPDLALRVDAWLEGTLETTAARGVERALVKYLARMSHRATPFGLFAGVSTGAWGPASRLALGPWGACRKAVRLDWGVLETLVNHLERAPEVRSRLRYRPNSSIYTCAGWYRYLESRDQPGTGRTYHLEAVEATPHLDFALQQAEPGARLDDLTMSLAQHLQVPPAEARSFLEQIIQAQLLGAELHPR